MASKADVEAMVVALFTLIGGIERATRRSEGASTLGVLQVVAGRGQVRPSEIAAVQGVHPSLVTRQVQSLEVAGYVAVSADPADRRSCLVRLTEAGYEEAHRLQQVGLDRFATFVDGWEPGEVNTLTALLQKLETSKASVAANERQHAGRRRAGTGRDWRG